MRPPKRLPAAGAPRKPLRMLARSALFVSILALTACETSFVPAKNAEPILLEGQDVAEVRAAIIRAMKLRKFKPQREEPGKIVARLERGDEMIEVSIEYSSSQFLIRYLSSDGLETIKENGELLVDDAYDSYKKKLAVVIEKELQRPAQERAESERNRREYELLLARAKSGADNTAQSSPGGSPVAPPSIGQGVGQIIDAAGPAVPQVQVNGSVKHSEQSLTCCINGSKYLCPGQDAFNACLSNGPSQCTPAGGC